MTARRSIKDEAAAAKKRELARRAQREAVRQKKLEASVAPPQHDSAPDIIPLPTRTPVFVLMPPRPGSFWYPLYKWLGGV